MDSYPENKHMDTLADVVEAMENPTEERVRAAVEDQRRDLEAAQAQAHRALECAPEIINKGVRRAIAINVLKNTKRRAIDLTSEGSDATEVNEEEIDIPQELENNVSPVLTDGKSRRRLVCGTLSIASAPKSKLLNFLKWLDSECDVLVYQCEKGKEGGAQGYEHIQFCCRFRKQTLYSTIRLQMNGIKGWLRGIEGPDGLAKMVNYCSKPDTRIEGPSSLKGKDLVLLEGKGKSGARTDILKFRKFMMENPTVLPSEIPEEHIVCYAKYGRLADQLRYGKPIKVPFKRAYCLYGKSGVGKTARAKIMAEELGLTYYVKDSSNLWWDGYTGQDCIIVDEVRAGQAGSDSKKILTMFLQLLDPEDAYLAQIKGSFSYIRAKLFIFTSPVHPSQWFHHTDFEDDPAAQLLRRFTKVTELKEPFAHPKAQDPEPLEATKFDQMAEQLFKD